MEVVVPPNTTATVYVPAKNPAVVTESGSAVAGEAGQPAATAKGVKFLRAENGMAVCEVGSGYYYFSSATTR